MNLSVYENFERIGVIDDFESLIWHRKYYTSGVFKLKLPATDANLALVKEKRFIHKPGSDEAGIIDKIKLNNTVGDSESIEVEGYFLTGILARRIIPTQTTLYLSYRDIMHRLVNLNCVNTTNKRVIPGLQMPTLAADTAEKVRLQVTGKNLLTYIGKVSQVAEMGFKILFKRNYMEFHTYEGVDHSKNQTKNPRVIFSQEYDNLESSEYTYNETSKVTSVYVAGEGEGLNRTVIEVDNGETGLDRYESYSDERSGREDGMTDAQYLELLKQKGLEIITPAAENFSGSIAESETTVYKQDFDLGDIVTVIDKRWNKEISARITEVEEVDDTSGSRIVIYFGTTEPTLADILKE